MSREAMLKLIAKNIREHGFHTYLVQQSTIPRFVYTIGLHGKCGTELIFPGGIAYPAEEVLAIVDSIGEELIADKKLSPKEFTLREADGSWVRGLCLGALDYHQTPNIRALQVVPADEEKQTIDIPDTSVEWTAEAEPVWRWQLEKWSYPVPESSTVTTNLDALLGYAVTEAVRWEEDSWEMFSGEGSEVTDAQMRVAPLGTLLGFDPTLWPALNLGIGEGLVRENLDDPWTHWRKQKDH